MTTEAKTEPTVAPSEPTKAELTASLDTLWEKHSTVGRDLKAATAVINEIRGVERKIADYEANAQKAARDAAQTQGATALKPFDMRKLMPGIIIRGVYRKGDKDVLDDLTIGIETDDVVLRATFHELFPDDTFNALSSVKGIKFTISREGAEVEYTGRAPSSGGGGNGGGGGKGWSKGGVQYKLNDIFEANATAEDRKALADANGDGNKVYGVKVKVAKRSEYTLNT